MNSWNRELSFARRAAGVGLPDLAARTGIAQSTLRSYEVGRRVPDRGRLLAVLDALSLSQKMRNAIISGAGYALDTQARGRRDTARFLTLEAAAALVDARPWPSLVINDVIEMLAANRLFRRLWGISPQRLRDPIGRNVLTMATELRFASRCLNWDDTVAMLIALFKAEGHRGESLERPSAYFAAVLEWVYAGDPRLVTRFIDLWDRTAGAYPDKVVWTYPIVWAHPVVGTMRFTCVAASVNEVDCLDIDDWIPSGAESALRVEALGRSPRRASTTSMPPSTPS